MERRTAAKTVTLFALRFSATTVLLVLARNEKPTANGKKRSTSHIVRT